MIDAPKSISKKGLCNRGVDIGQITGNHLSLNMAHVGI